MSKDIWAKDYIEKIGNKQWKYLMKLTLLFQEEQSLLLGGDLIPNGDDLSTERNFHLIGRCRSSLSFKS